MKATDLEFGSIVYLPEQCSFYIVDGIVNDKFLRVSDTGFNKMFLIPVDSVTSDTVEVVGQLDIDAEELEELFESAEKTDVDYQLAELSFLV